MPTRSTRRRNRISVQYALPRRGVPGAASLRKWAAPFGKAVTLRIVDAREGRALNRAFRNKDYATNVLSFAYGPGQGDLVLCHPVIAREAREQRKSLSAHYAHLVLHGMLHLGGHRHATRRQAAAMERTEIRMLARLGYADPYTIE